MDQKEKEWLVNRIKASIDDDFYLDREEEKIIKQEGSAKGIFINEIDELLEFELNNIGAVSERCLLIELERLLHLYTDNDKELDRREERDALDRVLLPASSKKRGLDNKVAEEYVTYFCKTHGVRRNSEFLKQIFLPASLLCVFAVGGIVFYLLNPVKTEVVTEKIIQNVVEKSVANSSAIFLTDKDKLEIDNFLRRAEQFIEKAQYTDPPEKSAKTCIDEIKQIDPNGQYRGSEVKNLSRKIVNHYIELAERSGASNDSASASKWLDRAKLMNTDREVILEKEKSLGLVTKNEK
jgi:hypothetical protein